MTLKPIARLSRYASLLALAATLWAQSTAPPTITSTSPLPTGSVNVGYTYQFTQSNCAQCPWSLFSGTLPPGLTLSPSGLLSGTPTTAGTFNFVVELGAFRSPVTKAFEATINPAATLTIFTQNQLNPVTALTNYSQTFVALNGLGTLAWSKLSGTLPPGTVLDPQTGVLAGIPTASAQYEFTIQVKDGQNRTAAKFFTLFVRPALAFLAPATLTPGAVGVPYSLIFQVDGGVAPYAFAFVSGAVPAGLTYNPAASVLNGSPLTPGASQFTLRVTDDEGTVTNKTFSLTIAAALAITTTALPDAGINVPYSAQLAGANGKPPYKWAVTASELPPGITLSDTGLLLGTPTQLGAFPMTIRLTDTASGATSKSLTLTVRQSPPPGLISSAVSLRIRGIVDGDDPPFQFVALVSTDGNRVPFTTTFQQQGGTWLRFRPLKGTTPVRMSIGAATEGLREGTYTARITVTGGGRVIPIDITLDMERVDPAMSVTPQFLRFAGTPAQLTGDVQGLTIRSLGAGMIPFTASLKGGARWLTLNPLSAEAVPKAPGGVKVLVNPAGLAPGAYREVVVITSAFKPEEIPVTMLVAPPGPALLVPTSGLFFDLRAGNGRSLPRAVNILGPGDSPANWTAKLLFGGEWLRIDPANGSAAIGRPSTLTVRAEPGPLAAGVYYGLIEIASPGAYGSPQYITCVLNLRDPAGSPIPEPTPPGLLFPPGGPPREITLFTSSTSPVPFQTSASTDDGAEWLAVTPATGSASADTPGKVTATVTTAGLPPGIYKGDVTFSFASLDIRSVNVTLIVPPAATPSAGKEHSAAGCTPAKLALVHSGATNGFSSPTGWPAPIQVKVVDDCGDGVNSASVTASFSNGDPALTMKLSDATASLYTATWTPSRAGSQVTVTARATAPPLAAATADLIGGVSQNRVPVLAENGTLNVFHRQIGGALAPGSIVEIYGSDLASVSENPSVVPLVTSYKGTRVIIAGREAPLYYVSPGQVNAQLPFELDPIAPVQIIVQAGPAITQPGAIALTPLNPGVAAFADGGVIAQHGDYSPVTADSPAKAGEIITLYLVGMGAPTTPVGTGQPSPGVEPLARAQTLPLITIGGKQAQLHYAGLTPFAVGLYQINVAVPDLAPGTHAIVITQGSSTANETTLVVR